MTKEKLFTTMRDNLERIYKEDGIELDTYSQYLFEHMKNLNDLWNFLLREEMIHLMVSEDVYGFILNLVVPECGVDPGMGLSEAYQKAMHNVNDAIEQSALNTPLTWRSEIDYG